jgi:SAM-dependent methyltransferase
MPAAVVERFRDRVRTERARRAEQRQRAYQTEKARHLGGAIEAAIEDLTAYATSVRRCIEQVCPVHADARILEVGSGAHGIIFFLGFPNAIGVDPLADIYPSLFPAWQGRVKTLQAYGEDLPFDDGSFDLVLCDNVIDHAERPEAILAEAARVLRPGGTLYFTVHVHHPIYHVAATAHAAWNALGVRYEIGPFADHTVHFSLGGIRACIHGLPFRVLSENTGIREAKEDAKHDPPRHMGDRLKRLFFKNARYEIVAVRS